MPRMLNIRLVTNSSTENNDQIITTWFRKFRCKCLSACVWSALRCDSVVCISVPQLQNYSSFASRLRKRNVIVTTILSTLAYLSALELSFQLGSLNLSSQLLCFVHASNLLRAVFPAVVKVASYVCARLHHCVAVDATSGFHFLNPTLETS